MRKFLLVILLLLFSNLFAQDQADIQHDINQNLWKPFKQAFETLDAPALNSLYAQQVLRVTPAEIDTANNFKEANLERFENYKRFS